MLHRQHTLHRGGLALAAAAFVLAICGEAVAQHVHGRTTSRADFHNMCWKSLPFLLGNRSHLNTSQKRRLAACEAAGGSERFKRKPMKSLPPALRAI